MRIGLGVLARPADDFWSLTMPELIAALEGWREAHGGDADAARPPLRDELAAMMRRFPDR